jgi:hypothetical protein
VNPLIYVVRLPNYQKTFYLLYWRRGSWLWIARVTTIPCLNAKCWNELPSDLRVILRGYRVVLHIYNIYFIFSILVNTMI